MRIKLAYGKTGLEIDVPDSGVDVIQPRFVAGIEDERLALQNSLRHPFGSPPLRDLVTPSDTVAIIFSDRTRPMPSDRVLPVILSEIEAVPRENITLINAVGTHRENTREELISMVGKALVDEYRIVQHRPRDRSSLLRLGTSSFGNEVWVNRNFMEAKVKILTGFIEPHFFAGFSGGPKSVLLGVGGFDSILRNHSAQMIENSNATWGITDENPIHQEMSEIAELVGPNFIVNVTLNRNRQITGIFSGHWREAHRRGCEFAGKTAMQPVDQLYDLVVTTNSGFPLDMNLYQAVKGMSAAARIVKPGGCIIAAAECSDGIPEHGHFRELLRRGNSPQEWLEAIFSAKEIIPDQWQVQILARILQHAQVHLFSTLPAEEVRRAGLRVCENISLSVQQMWNKVTLDPTDFRMAVLPEGPQTVPYLAS